MVLRTHLSFMEAPNLLNISALFWWFSGIMNLGLPSVELLNDHSQVSLVLGIDI